jgi:stress response protein YsnF
VISSEQISQVVGSTAYDVNGDKIGKIGQVYLDDSTGEPAWATVNTGLFGTHESFVPVDDSAVTDSGTFLGHDKDKIKGAPQVAGDGHLSPEDEALLYDYYGVAYVDRDTTVVTDTDDSAPSASTDGAMTRSEERLEVTGTERAVTGRARLRKYVETEEVTVTVPVRKEKVVLETAETTGSAGGSEPVTDAEAAAYQQSASEGAAEVILHEEVPVVHTEVRAVERVRLGTEEVVEEQTISGEVRKERIIAEGDGVDGRENTGTAR